MTKAFIATPFPSKALNNYLLKKNFEILTWPNANNLHNK